MSNPGSAPPGGGGVQTVNRAITVLELLAHKGEAGVTELADEINVHKSTVFRLLGALEARGLVEQHEDRGKYRLGFGMVRLAGAVTGQMDLVQHARGVCERLAHQTEETVNLAIRQEIYAVNVDQAMGPSALTTQDWVGKLTPLHATASGKILLAHFRPERRTRLLRSAGDLERFTPQTVTSLSELNKQLDIVLERGYAVSYEEYEIGLNGVAAPVMDADGTAVAALSASGPTYRFDEARILETLPDLTAAADGISARLGYLGSQ